MRNIRILSHFNSKRFNSKRLGNLFGILFTLLTIFIFTLMASVSDSINSSLWEPIEVNAMISDYGWTRNIGEPSSDQAWGVTTDANGNIYMVGNFRSEVDFNTTGSGDSDFITSNGNADIFITKYNSDGSYGWTRSMGGMFDGDSGYNVTTDSSGNVYMVGYFRETSVEFNTTGSGSSDPKDSNGLSDVFITKYNSDGSYGWTRTMGGSDDDEGYGVAVDSNDNVYMVGKFRGTSVEFNTTGSGSSDSKDSNGNADVFITKYNSDGSYGWTRTIGGSYSDVGRGITVDGSDNIYFTGSYTDASVEFNTTGSGVSDLHSTNGGADMFITKYNSDGSYGWSYSVGGSGSEYGYNLSVDSSDNVYMTGEFSSSNVDFNTTGSGGSDLKSSNGNSDIFITKYNSDGSYGWSRAIGGGSYDIGYGVAVDGDDNIYMTGYFSGTGVNFNTTGVGSNDAKDSNGAADMFVTKYSSDSSYAWTRTVGGTDDTIGKDITSDGNSNLYIAGYFSSDNVDFNTTGSGSSDVHSAGGIMGGTNIFLTKYQAVFQIANLESSLNVSDDLGNDISVDGDSGLSGNIDVYLKSSTGEILSVVDVSMDADRDWSTVSGDIDTVNGKSVVDGLTSAPGTASTHKLYIPVPSIGGSSSVRICPDATDMNGVTVDCSNGVEFEEGQTQTVGTDTVTVTRETVDDQEYWVADGVSGTGGMSLFSSFDLKDTLTRLEVSQASDHTIEFGSINGLGEVGDTIEIQFDPSGQNWDLSSLTVADIDLEDDGVDLTLAAAADATHWGVDIDTGTDTITFTHPTDGAFEDIASSSILVVKVGTVADGGSNQITNPSTVAEYEVNMTNTYSAGTGGTETGEVEIPIVDDDTVNVTGYIDTVMSFDIDTAVGDVQCDATGGGNACNSHGGATDSAGYVVDLGEMTLSSVNKSGDTVVHADGLSGDVNYIWFDLETNASSGAVVTVVSEYEALYKDGTNEIPSVATGSEQQILAASGLYGLNHRSGFTNTQTIGSMIVDVDCDASAGDDYYCDIADGGTPISIFDSNNLPIDDGRMQFAVGAAPDSADGTGTYTDQLTFVATATF